MPWRWTSLVVGCCVGGILECNSSENVEDIAVGWNVAVAQCGGLMK